MIHRPFPDTRMRRLRKHPWLRSLTQEHQLCTNDLILPLFVHAHTTSTPIDTLPGVVRHSLSDLLETCKKAANCGITAIALFPVVDPQKKDANGSEALRSDSLITQAIQVIRQANLNMGIICDCALDPYTNHSHDGVLQADGDVDNDKTISLLAQQAVLLAKAGADVIAPSDMQDGRIGLIRQALDKAGYQEVSILSYTAKYASHFYGPFRDAVGADGLRKSYLPHQKTDKKTYQMNPANRLEAIHIAKQHLFEGADCLMVKPAMSYLDVLYQLHHTCQVPIFAYQVSGEFAMLSQFAKTMQIDFTSLLHESLIACKRAGASAILTYGAISMAQAL